MDISAYLQSYLVTNDDKVISNIPNFLSIAVSRVNKRMKSAFLELYGYDLILPADFVAMKYLTVNGAQYSPNLVQLQGTYTINAGQLTVYPALESGDILAFVYYAINQSILTQGSPAVLLHGAAAEALMFEGNKEDAAAENLLFNQDLDECLGWESHGTLTLAGSGGGTEGISVPTPPPPPTLPASAVTFQPSGTIEAGNVQAAIQELDGETQTALVALAGDVANLGADKVDRAGDTMTGDLKLPASMLKIGNETALPGVTLLNALLSTESGGGVSLICRKSNPAGNSPNMGMAKSRGTAAAPAAVQANDGMGAFVTFGFDGTNYIQSGYNVYYVDGPVSGGKVPSRWSNVVTNAAGVPVEAMAILSDLSVTLGGAIGAPAFKVIPVANQARWATATGAPNSENPTIGGSAGQLNLAGIIQMAGLPALNYANDGLAAAGGVPIGGLYHNAGAVRVRLV